MTTDSTWTWGAVIDAVGGTNALAKALDESTSTVSGWRSRPGGIPGKHWASIVRIAAEAGRTDLTLEILAALAAAKAVEEART